MRQKIDKARKYILLVLLIQAALLAVLGLIVHLDILYAIIVFIVECVCFYILFERIEKYAAEQSIGVKSTLGTVAKEAYLKGGIGILIYDEDYIITFMSELFESRHSNRLGTKLLTWIPEADELIAGRSDKAEITLDDRRYEITRKDDAPVLFFRDVTELELYKGKYEGEHIVMGLASFDNYEETTLYLDEAEMTVINTAVRLPLTEYCAAHGIFCRRLNTNYRYMLVLNERILNEIMADRFSVLNTVRKSAQKQDVLITLSMAFARGTSDFAEMEAMVVNLMDLAQTRGGDQVAVQTKGQEVRYFGGSTEAAEKRSRVRVRVMSHALRDLIQRSSNVIICGHKTADFDCIGSAICLSRMAAALHKQVVIIAKTGGIEEKLNAVMKANEAKLKEQVTFVTEGEAINQLQENTLVIMTDHHNVKQSNGAKLLEQARKVAIIDHHRRSTEIGVKPILMYIEASASSTCELLTEMIPYISSNVDISELAATIMLAGMVVDTQKWRVRTGSRTYEAAAELRKLGGDPQEVYDYLKDTFDEISVKSEMISQSEKLGHGVVVSCVHGRTTTRSLMSQVADTLLSVQGITAAFVISNVTDTETAISARSDGSINVQMIMEKMQGGGHMTAAATQRSRTTVDALKKELTEVLEQYFREEKNENESHS